MRREFAGAAYRLRGSTWGANFEPKILLCMFCVCRTFQTGGRFAVEILFGYYYVAGERTEFNSCKGMRRLVIFCGVQVFDWSCVERCWSWVGAYCKRYYYKAALLEPRFCRQVPPLAPVVFTASSFRRFISATFFSCSCFFFSSSNSFFKSFLSFLPASSSLFSLFSSSSSFFRAFFILTIRS